MCSFIFYKHLFLIKASILAFGVIILWALCFIRRKCLAVSRYVIVDKTFCSWNQYVKNLVSGLHVTRWGNKISGDWSLTWHEHNGHTAQFRWPGHAQHCHECHLLNWHEMIFTRSARTIIVFSIKFFFHGTTVSRSCATKLRHHWCLVVCLLICHNTWTTQLVTLLICLK